MRVEPKGLSFETDGEASLLDAAARGGVVLPSSCRNGTCRTCVCRVHSGSARHLIEWPGLSLDEKREGYILPCVAVATSDLVLEAPAARRSG
ncbi:2Fe-2S iron-sulfur cluster binding domain-containing protein [Pseudoduganella sp. DS3]|uniref:2Fe-2S iron-sulfur cluster binding domain-containing protein n=1 Tax=Pseudoduganella guangdongensis TaxID=2692179 RepID=A0A6N9HJ17_9BURK|nr:2Fe-2S iron-sulfur cluster binding domain-containing protein [Pseudoduganella guangdongensis]